MKSDTRSPSSRRSAGGRSTASAPTEATARKQRRIQAEQDRRDGAGAARKKSDDKKAAVQAGARRQPEKLPAQHLKKPGHEADLALAPQFAAPVCAGYITGIVLPVTGSVGAI